MPFIRQARDKRGFEHTFVMHTYHPGANTSPRPRVLYMFRSPANLKVGRTALDGEVMEALEHTHPDLSFDWSALTQDPAASRMEVPSGRQSRRPTPRSAGRPSPRPAPEPPAALPDDGSLLGRVLGAAEAARLRRRHSELAQRISRRARTPEERDRLFERARRLNPDDWPDEAGIRAQAPTVDAAWEVVAAELPARRRGRRGGRGRPDEERAPSVTMTGEHPTLDEVGHEGPEEARAGGTDDPGGDSGAVGSAANGTDAKEGTADPDVPLSD